MLIDKLIPNEELKQRYIDYGLCEGCKQINTGYSSWCQPCSSRCFQQNFKNWTSGNSDVDKLIQESQLNAKNGDEKLEWIEYDRLKTLSISQREVLGKYIKQIGRMDIYLIGIMKLING